MPLWHHHVHGLRFTSYVHRRRFAVVELFNLHIPQEITMPPVTVSIGHTIAFSIEYLDANGNPMLTPQTPDAPPTWTNTATAIDTLAVSPDGTTAVDTAVAAGADTVTVSLAVGGVSFTASDPIIVSPAPQVLTSVAIKAVVS